MMLMGISSGGRGTTGSGGAGTLNDYATVKYNANGTQLWVARYNGPDWDGDYSKALSVDASGNVYVTGYSYGGGFTGNDYATVKYNATGNQLWVAWYNGPGNLRDYATALTVDVLGNIYVTGYSWGMPGNL